MKVDASGVRRSKVIQEPWETLHGPPSIGGLSLLAFHIRFTSYSSYFAIIPLHTYSIHRQCLRILYRNKRDRLVIGATSRRSGASGTATAESAVGVKDKVSTATLVLQQRRAVPCKGDPTCVAHRPRRYPPRRTEIRVGYPQCSLLDSRSHCHQTRKCQPAFRHGRHRQPCLQGKTSSSTKSTISRIRYSRNQCPSTPGIGLRRN